MEIIGWVHAAAEILPHVVRVECPDSSGSGFLAATKGTGKDKIAVIVTASHVVEHAFDWAEPIKISGAQNTTTLFPGEFKGTGNGQLDIATIELPWKSLDLPPSSLSIADSSALLPAGCPVAWCGYPNIIEGRNCLFAGHVSASIAERGDYIVDGVIIHGISGGPAFVYDGEHVVIIGVLSKYLPNRATGEALPGLGVVRNIAPLTKYFLGPEKAQKSRRRTAGRHRRG
jgi:hypothetical protein